MSKYLPKKPISKIVALLLTIIAGVCVYFIGIQLYKPVPVLIATTNINSSTVLNESNTRIIQVAKNDRHPNALTEMPKDLCSKIPIYNGQQIIKEQLVGSLNENALAGIKKNQTLVVLTTQQAFWPRQLREGDLVTVEAVYPETNEIRQEAIGRIIVATSGSVIKNMKSIQEATAVSPEQTEITFITDTGSARKVLLALKTAELVYLMPRHPALGGVD